jgi:hypothetical protein
MLNTLVHKQPVSVGSQWVLFVATHEGTYIGKESP